MADTGVIRLDPRAQEFRPRTTAPPPNPNPTPTPTLPYHQPFFPPTLPPLLPPAQLQLFNTFATSTTATPYLHLAPAPPFADAYNNFPPPPPPPQHHAPSRAVVLSMLPSDVSETAVRRELEVVGEVRAVEMERAAEGTVTVHFYDLRHAKRVVREIREQYDRAVGMRDSSFCPSFLRGSGKVMFGGRAVWAQFVIPVVTCIPEGQNQGTIVIFNLDPAISIDTLRQIFEAFGPVKELRETPYKKHQKFVEFYDTRDASRALREMNGKEINGRSVVIEFSRPGGFSRKLLNAAASSANFHESFLNPLITSGYDPRTTSGPPQLQFQQQPQPPLMPIPPPRNFLHGEVSPSDRTSIEGSMCSLSLDAGGGGDASGSGREDDHVYARKCGKKKQGSNCGRQQLQQQSKGKHWKGKRQHGKLDSRFVITDDAVEEPRSSGDSRTTIMIKNIPNKYREINSQKLLLSMLDNHCIHCNEQIAGEGDSEQPFSSYDFVYLPIDFNNKCNVGYGFVNMTTPQAARRLYKAFHRRHWEVFNSRKICEVTYARIQGLDALKEHFKNSKFPSEMDHYLPVVFSPPRDGRTLTDPLPVVGHKQHPNNPITEEGEEGEEEEEESDGDEMAMGMDGVDLGGVGNSSDGEHHLVLSGGGSSSISRQSSNGGGVDYGNDDGF